MKLKRTNVNIAKKVLQVKIYQMRPGEKSNKSSKLTVVPIPNESGFNKMRLSRFLFALYL